MGRKPKAELRRGWTTGACAAAATKAAYLALLTGRFPNPVAIRLPGGEQPRFDLIETTLHRNRALAAVIKDAGDDPDVTHGALIRASVSRGEPGAGVMFIAGEGVGVVTRPGLPVAVGEPAINPASAPADPRPGRRSGARSRRCRRSRGDDRDPWRRDPGATDDQRPARHRRRPVGSRHHRHRDSLFLRLLDPLDPSRHRRGARRGRRPTSPRPPDRPPSAPCRRSTACRTSP